MNRRVKSDQVVFVSDDLWPGMRELVMSIVSCSDMRFGRDALIALGALVDAIDDTPIDEERTA